MANPCLCLAVVFVYVNLGYINSFLNSHLFPFLDNGVMRPPKRRNFILSVFTCLCFSESLVIIIIIIITHFYSAFSQGSKSAVCIKSINSKEIKNIKNYVNVY